MDLNPNDDTVRFQGMVLYEAPEITDEQMKELIKIASKGWTVKEKDYKVTVAELLSVLGK